MTLVDLKRLKRKLVNMTGGGTQEAIAAVSGQIICIWAMELVLSASTTLEWRSATTTICPAQTLSSKVLDFMNTQDALYPRYKCNVSEALNLVFGASVNCGGVIYYTQE